MNAVVNPFLASPRLRQDKRVVYYQGMTPRKRIIVDPKIMVGKPVIAGTRIPAALILEKLADGAEVHTILQDYPRLTKEDIQAVLQYAHDVVRGEDVYPTA